MAPRLGFLPSHQRRLLTVGVVIDDMTLDNGCLLVLPGSQKGTVFDHHVSGMFVGSVRPWAGRRRRAASRSKRRPGRSPSITPGCSTGRPRTQADSLDASSLSSTSPATRGLSSAAPGRTCRADSSAAKHQRYPGWRLYQCRSVPRPEQSGSIYELQATEPERTTRGKASR